MMTITMPSAGELADALVSGSTYSARAFRMREEDELTLPPFTPTRLHVQHHRGRAVSVVPMDFDWAEADPRQQAYVRAGVLILAVEDYQLEIEIASILG